MTRLGILVCSLLLGLCPLSLNAQQTAGKGAQPAVRSAQRQRLDWLRTHIPRLVTGEQERAEVMARLNQLSDDEIQRLTTRCLEELEARRKQQFLALREANARERAFREQMMREFPARSAGYPAPYAAGFFGAPPVGYFPVITWLPEGVSMSAHAVVSPDRRHVRMSLNPFFSTIGPVHTFNFLTGETRRYDP